jgi:hypothetical protein
MKVEVFLSLSLAGSNKEVPGKQAESAIGQSRFLNNLPVT